MNLNSCGSGDVSGVQHEGDESIAFKISDLVNTAMLLHLKNEAVKNAESELLQDEIVIISFYNRN